MEIISYELKDFEYQQPHVTIDENGEIQLSYDPTSIQIGSITLLYQVDYDEDGNLTYSHPIEAANNYLMYQKIHYGTKCTSLMSRGLLNFFSFIEQYNEQLEETNKVREERGQLPTPPLRWDVMPERRNERPTYLYRNFLKESYKSLDPETRLARSTCNGYMNAVINFYKHYITELDYTFGGYKPFEYATAYIDIQSGYGSMRATHKKQVLTTNLRLGLPKESTESSTTRKLQALEPYEWEELDKILRQTGKVIVSESGRERLRKLAYEYRLIFLLMYWTGLRREEVLTLRSSLLFKPKQHHIKNGGYVELEIGAHVGVSTKFDKVRTIEMPAPLMAKLYDYIHSDRYQKRYEKNKEKLTDHEARYGGAYLFLSNRGDRFTETSVNARWSDIRRTLEAILEQPFKHKPHNLRSTYFVERYISLRDKLTRSSKEARNHLLKTGGHSDISTLEHYMQVGDDRRNSVTSPQEDFENMAVEMIFGDGHFEALASTGKGSA